MLAAVAGGLRVVEEKQSEMDLEDRWRYGVQRSNYRLTERPVVVTENYTASSGDAVDWRFPDGRCLFCSSESEGAARGVVQAVSDTLVHWWRFGHKLSGDGCRFWG